MNTSALSKRSRKWREIKEKRRELWKARVARMNAARERKRLKRVADEPKRVEWRGRHELTVTFHDRMTGEMHSLDLYRGQRRDQYDADVDGKQWKRGLSATQLATYFRKKLKPHILCKN